MASLTLKFNNDFTGETSVGQYSWKLGNDGANPYDLAMSGLVSCFYATFIDIAAKKRLTWDNVNINIEWEKDVDGSPQFLKQAHLDVKISGSKASKKEKYDETFEQASRYCSLYQTFSKIAEISFSVEHL